MSVHTANVATSIGHLREGATTIFVRPAHVIAVVAAACVDRSRGANVSPGVANMSTSTSYSPMRRVQLLTIIATGG